MSFNFSKRSKDNLATCHLPLQKLAKAALATSPIDFVVIQGHRSKADQDKAVASGASKLRWPKSKHNAMPSYAFDAIPYPVNWADLEAFKVLGAHIKATWEAMPEEDKEGYKLEWGGDWARFVDFPHYQIVK